MKTEKYKMSFTTGGLFRQESVEIARLYLQLNNWNIVRDKVLTENVLQTRTITSSKRIVREICSRLKKLSLDELNLLVEGSAQEQGYLLWMAVCRHYKFIADFAVEVIRERYITLNQNLQYEDFDFFFNKKSEWHDEIELIKPTTRKKLRQVFFKMLREADLLTKNNTIIGAMLTPRLLDTIQRGDNKEIFIFPAFESDLGAPSQ